MVTRFPALIGSRPDAEVPLPLPEVAPSQARLLWVGDSLYLTDLARAGTTVKYTNTRWKPLREAANGPPPGKSPYPHPPLTKCRRIMWAWQSETS